MDHSIPIYSNSKVPIHRCYFPGGASESWHVPKTKESPLPFDPKSQIPVPLCYFPGGARTSSEATADLAKTADKPDIAKTVFELENKEQGDPEKSMETEQTKDQSETADEPEIAKTVCDSDKKEECAPENSTENNQTVLDILRSTED